MLIAMVSVFLLGLLLAPTSAPIAGTDPWVSAEAFFFERQETSILAYALTGFLVWNRRWALLALPSPRPDARLAAGANSVCVAGLAALAWARLVEASDLHLLAVTMLFVALCVAWKGRPALRILRLPIVAALFILPLPAPLYNELVWACQRFATDGAAWILWALRVDFASGSMLIRLEGHDFWVIETCSGLRATELLTLVAILIVELSPRREPRAWLIVAIAPFLALTLNVVRIVAIVLYDSSTANDSNHLAQGLVTVFVGAAILSSLQYRVFAQRSSPGPTPGDSPAEPAPVTSWPRVLTGVLLFGMTAVAVVVSPAAPRGTTGPRIFDAVPQDRPGWTSTQIDAERLFFFSLPIGDNYQRRYERSSEPGRASKQVDLYVGEKKAGAERSTLASTKFGWLGPTWESTRLREATIWQLGTTATWYQLRRGDEHALALVWYRNFDGGWKGAVRSALGTDRLRVHDVYIPQVFRLTTPIRVERNESFALANAERAINQFLEAYTDALTSVEPARPDRQK